MDSLEIKQVAITSEPAQKLIAELDRELGLTYAPEHRFTVDVNAFENVGGVFLIGTIAEEHVACGAIRPIDQTTAEIKRMFVIQSFRGRGLARQILSQLETVAKENGFTRIVLETGDDQHIAQRLYKNTGYQQIDPFGEYLSSPRSVCFGKNF